MTPRRQIFVGVHLVWGTKHRRPWLTRPIRLRLNGYLSRILLHHECRPLAVGGWVDHIHVYAALSPKVPLGALVIALKANSSRWLRREMVDLQEFFWQRGFAAFGVDPRDDADLRRYIQRQEEIHTKRSIPIDPRQLIAPHPDG